MSWDPGQYLKNAGPRLRPALDLLAAIPTQAPETVVDLGCGPGNITPLLAGRWPEARILGLDNSPDMLARAREAAPDFTFAEADAATWTAEEPVDVIYANAALHWLEDHDRQFPRLLAQLRPGGVLAAQMPRNHFAPSHRLMAEAFEAGAWSPGIPTPRGLPPVHDPADYYRLLAPLCDDLEIWESEYLQVLEGEDPVKEYTKATGLRPYLAALEGADLARFEADYAARLRLAYPPEADGRTLFPFRRLFLVARRASR